MILSGVSRLALNAFQYITIIVKNLKNVNYNFNPYVFYYKWVHLKKDSNAGHFSEFLLKIGDGKYLESEEKITLCPRLGIYLI